MQMLTVGRFMPHSLRRAAASGDERLLAWPRHRHAEKPLEQLLVRPVMTPEGRHCLRWRRALGLGGVGGLRIPPPVANAYAAAVLERKEVPKPACQPIAPCPAEEAGHAGLGATDVVAATQGRGRYLVDAQELLDAGDHAGWVARQIDAERHVELVPGEHAQVLREGTPVFT